MTKKTDRHYMESSALAEQLILSQQQGQPTEKLCGMFMEIAKRMLNSGRFRGYDWHLKQDMASDALLKCIKNIKNFKKQYAASAFSYFTACVQCSFFGTLNKHYKLQNLKRACIENLAQELQDLDPQAADFYKKLLRSIDSNNIEEKGED